MKHAHRKVNNSPYHITVKELIAVSTIIIILFIGFFFVKLIASQTKPVIETNKSEIKKIPSDVKANLRKQLEEKTATISATIRVPILMYHYVEYVQDKRDTIRQSLNINPDVFESQVKTLVDAGYTFMTAKNLGDVIDGKMKLPAKPVLLTFDDGHWDFDTVVLPILKKYHVHGTAYIISSFIGGSDFMTKDELEDVIQSGLVDVGAHTVHHIALKDKLLPVVQYEVGQSKKDLESTYHIKVVSFAYPNGSFDQQAIDVVKAAGFTTAVSTVPGIMQNNENRFYLYRLRPGYRTGEELLNYLQGTSFRAY